MGRRDMWVMTMGAMALLYLGLAGSIFAGSGSAGELSVRWEVSGTEITTADQVRAELVAEAAGDHVIDLGEDDIDFGDFAVVNRISSEGRLTAGGRRRVERMAWVLEPFLAGEYVVPAMTVTARPSEEGGEVLSFETEAVPVRVRSVLPGETKELDIKPMAPAGTAGERAMWGVLAMIVMVVVLGGAWWVRQRRIAGELEGGQVFPDEAALRDLDGIEGSGDPDEIGERLQTVFEGYVEAGELDLSGVDGEAATVLARFCEGVDRLRFSDGGRGGVQGGQLVDLCRRFIILTKKPRGEEARP